MELGFAVRIARGTVRAALPPTIIHSRLPYDMIAWFERCAARLHAASARYGLAPDAALAVVAQVDDIPAIDCVSLGFGRRAGAMAAIRLIPDGYFIGNEGYAQLRRAALGGEMAPWRERRDTVLWRGTTTGAGSFAHPLELPRIRLCHICRDVPNADVKIMGIFERTGRWLDVGEVGRVLDAERLRGERLPMGRYGEVRYTIDIDGYGNAWSLVEKLLCGNCVLKVDTPFEQWFYDRLRPWEHYVPVAADLTDLVERIDWCRANPDAAEAIAANGARLAHALTVEDALEHTARQIVSAGLAV